MSDPIERQVARQVLSHLYGRKCKASDLVHIEDGDLDGVRDLIREQLIRALTAQAWGVACALLQAAGPSFRIARNWESLGVAALPTPAQLADEILGGGR